MSRTSGSERTRFTEEVVFDAVAVDALPRTPMTAQPGVSIQTLWGDVSDGSYVGVMRIDPGARVTIHTHHYSVHHVLVTSGECVVRGKTLGPGSYCFVPAGVAHGIEAGSTGCTIFYLYLRAEMD